MNKIASSSTHPWVVIEPTDEVLQTNTPLTHDDKLSRPLLSHSTQDQHWQDQLSSAQLVECDLAEREVEGWIPGAAPTSSKA